MYIVRRNDMRENEQLSRKPSNISIHSFNKTPEKQLRETSLHLSPVLADRNHDKIVYGPSTSQQVSRWKRLRLSWKSILTFHYSFSFFSFARRTTATTSSRKSACETWNPMPVMEDSFFCFAIFLSALCPLFLLSTIPTLPGQEKAQAVGKSNISAWKEVFLVHKD